MKLLYSPHLNQSMQIRLLTSQSNSFLINSTGSLEKIALLQDQSSLRIWTFQEDLFQTLSLLITFPRVSLCIHQMESQLNLGTKALKTKNSQSFCLFLLNFQELKMFEDTLKSLSSSKQYPFELLRLFSSPNWLLMWSPRRSSQSRLSSLN